MPRYIDADALIDKIYPIDPENDGSDGCTIVRVNEVFTSAEIESVVQDMPTADVAPIVRCKDCIHKAPSVMATEDNPCSYCRRRNTYCYDNDFCSYGE